MEKPKIIIDTERMKYPFTGLYYYCKDLALHMDQYYQDQFDLYFYSHKKIEFPSHLKRIFRKQIDKLFFYIPSQYQLWHITWQDTKYVPVNNTKIVYTIHDLNFLYTDKPDYKKKKLLEKVQKKFDRADAVTAISAFVKADIEKNIKTKGKEIRVIHNGVDFKEFPEFDSPKYRPKVPFLFTLGTVLFKKNFHVLPQLLIDNDYELLIAGIQNNEEYLNFLNAEIKKLGVENRVKLLGPITEEEKYWYNKNCLAFVFPSLSEGFGLPPIEAMKLGKPVFLSTLTSLPEVGGNLAYYFDNFEGDSMRKVLNEGLIDYQIHNRKPKITAWANQYSWEKAVDQYAQVYKEVLGLSNNKITELTPKISAIIPTFNEEINIENAIKSVLFCDEIIILDSYSTDKTVEFATKYPVKIHYRKFDDFSSQKNYGITLAKNDWILYLDADEVITNKVRNEIIHTLNSNPKEKAFQFKMNYVFLGKIMQFGGFQSKKVIRLFHKNFAHYKGIVHEALVVEGKIKQMQNPILHQNLQNLDSFIDTQNQYAHLKATKIKTRNRIVLNIKKYVKTFYRFIKHYIIRFGFLDGKQGFIFAKIQAKGVSMVYDILLKAK